MEPDGMLKGWNRNERRTSASRSACTITDTVSQTEPSDFFFDRALKASSTAEPFPAQPVPRAYGRGKAAPQVRGGHGG